jgi:peroxiredoxin
MRTGIDAPNFTLKEGDGNDWTLSDHRGEQLSFDEQGY